jgi:hypothetical protein
LREGKVWVVDDHHDDYNYDFDDHYDRYDDYVSPSSASAHSG